ncbi:rhomboid family intramembrane serine protease [Paludisphaera mucosa]|uniref:Rhomboid family intramembrane serine protease n=1 Tax=Paludisphaera mucosa TaxID=3030827 RepID=A0ABT6FH51_9BACT|nr:rhomboid family intramembrane serine protease [Paludisphaera mucosa]MDG3006906.1 rhomboid family intramembrane serine protease [Paludisphaera mucosa]
MVLPLGDLHRTRITPVVTYALIALNVVMYVVQLQRGDDFMMALACTPWEITHAKDLDGPVLRPGVLAEVQRREANGERVRLDLRDVIPHAPSPIPVWLTLFTAMFLHGGPMHLAGNMLYLWIVGDNVEEVLGGVRYLIVYLACGLMGSLAQIAAAPNSMIPTLGASGAIAGIMGAYVVWFPHNQIRVLVFRFITVLPAAIVIGGWIALQIWLGVQGIGKMGESGGVAYLAHVGGALTGILVAFLFYDRAQQVKAMDEYGQGWQSIPPDGS